MVTPPTARTANNTTDATLIGASLLTVAESTFKGIISAATAKAKQTLATIDPTKLPRARRGRLGCSDTGDDELGDTGAEAADYCGGNRWADTHRGRDTCQGDYELIAADGEHNQAPEQPDQVEPQGGRRGHEERKHGADQASRRPAMELYQRIVL